MEQAFYSTNANPDLRSVRPPEAEESNNLELESFIEKLRNASPEKLAVSAELFKG